MPSKTIKKINEIRRRRIESHQNDLVKVLEDGLDHRNKHDFQREMGSSLLRFKSDFFHPIPAATFLGELGDYIPTSCFLILKASRGICHLNINTCHFGASAGITHADIFLGRPTFRACVFVQMSPNCKYYTCFLRKYSNDMLCQSTCRPLCTHLL